MVFRRRSDWLFSSHGELTFSQFSALEFWLLVYFNQIKVLGGTIHWDVNLMRLLVNQARKKDVEESEAMNQD